MSSYERLLLIIFSVHFVRDMNRHISTAEKAKHEKIHKFHFLPVYLLLKPSLHMFPSSQVPCLRRIEPPVQVHLAIRTNARFRQSLRRQRRAPMTVHPHQSFLPSVLNLRSHLYTPTPIAILPLPRRGKTLIPSRKNELPASDHRISC
jgi:hypothetical protein